MSTEARARLREMCEQNFAFVWRILRRLGVLPQNVDDAAQQVFFVAARKIESIDPTRERAFLLGTALRIAAEARRSGARRREDLSDGLDAHSSPSPSPEQTVQRRESLEALDRILEAMPFELRTVFVLFEIEGLSTNEIAPSLGLPRGTVSSRLRRAREEFEAIGKREQARANWRGGERA
jgi:RNA polymerase sigma-70 factor (ECF subfamily)